MLCPDCADPTCTAYQAIVPLVRPAIKPVSFELASHMAEEVSNGASCRQRISPEQD